MAVTSQDTLSALADVQTIGQLRAALGVVTSFLQQGYAQLSDVSEDQGLREVVKGRLDDQNLTAQEIYTRQPTDIPAQAYEVGWQDSIRLGLLCSQTEDALLGVTEAAHVSEFHFGAALKQAVAETKQSVTDAATGVGETVGNLAAAPAKGLVSALTAFLDGAKTLIIIVAVGGTVYYFRRPILAAFAKGAK